MEGLLEAPVVPAKQEHGELQARLVITVAEESVEMFQVIFGFRPREVPEHLVAPDVAVAVVVPVAGKMVDFWASVMAQVTREAEVAPEVVADLAAEAVPVAEDLLVFL
jgi:hypothetical protein